MLGKGAKRKLEEDEDGLEGKALAPGGAADGPSKVSYSLQRQTIFSISLMKLYSQRRPPEPSLARRVLINNMLRRIQEELRWEGGPRPILFPPSAPPDDPADEGFREAQPAFGALSAAAAMTTTTPASPPPQAPPLPPPLPALPVSAPPDSCLTPASLLEDDAASFCTSPLPPHAAAAHHLLQHGLSRQPPASTALDETGGPGPPAAANATTTTSSVPAAPHLLLAGSDAKDCSKTCSQKFEGLVSQLEGRAGVATKAESRLMDSLPPSALDISPSPASGFLTDLALDDILFADIDTSMYDFDPCTTTAGVTASKMAPMVMADDLFKTLSPYGGAPTSSPPAQPFKMDLTELDHIMEVLVGS